MPIGPILLGLFLFVVVGSGMKPYQFWYLSLNPAFSPFWNTIKCIKWFYWSMMRKEWDFLYGLAFPTTGKWYKLTLNSHNIYNKKPRIHFSFRITSPHYSSKISAGILSKRSEFFNASICWSQLILTSLLSNYSLSWIDCSI